MSMYLG